MKTDTRAMVTTEAMFANFLDLTKVGSGEMDAEAVRRVVVTAAIVDTDEALLALPTSLIRQLGLIRRGTRRIRRATKYVEVALYGAFQLTIRGRESIMDALEAPEGTPVSIGHIALTHLDFVIDPVTRSLVGNPLHNGEHMHELY